MKRKITGFLLLLGLSLVLALWGCAAKPEEQAVSGSFVESEVPTPRLVYTARDGGKMRDLYYIPLSEELADMCREALDDPQKEKVEPMETVQLFQVELDKDQSFTVFETLSGNRFFSAGAVSGVKADEAAEALNDVIKDKSSSAEAVKQASDALEELAKTITLESDIENLITAKVGCENLVILNGDNAEIIVENGSLDDVSVVKIKEIAVKHSGCPVDGISIIEMEY